MRNKPTPEDHPLELICWDPTADQSSKDDGFRLLYQKYRGRITAYFRRRTSHHELAQELTQDVFAKLLRHQDVVENAGGLLFTIASRTLVDFYRGKSRARECELEHTKRSASVSIAFDLDDVIDTLALTRAVALLPQHYQEVYTLLHEGMTLMEISDALGTTEDAIKKRVQRLKKALREAITQ